ncbi:serine hydrolase [Loigolactobacillus jiayinensis]|uniref:Serine hydrolase n=1 Tax=Loigolactobacillus jiayinensis TaxID=2486016 RepID=A0ABW1RGD7_9LACO|nr:serine hydrolase [Loigolactobacillus jiayinensis]
MTVGLLFWRSASADPVAGQQNQSKTATASSTNTVATAATKQRTIITKNLQNYLKQVTADGDASVSFYSLAATNNSAADTTKNQLIYGDGKINVESNATTSETPASTYKLFIAAYLFYLRQSGQFSWTSTNRSGFYQMIVNSSNDFPLSIRAEYGTASINAFIKSQGWTSPVFRNEEATSTTSQSLRALLQNLAAGTGAFSNAQDQQYLLSLMKKQIYRAGIPAGVATVDQGATVADKVGFLDDVNNDAAIVTTSTGQRYILVIMTHGHNQATLDFSRIKAIAARVQQIVYGTNAGTELKNYSAD